MLLSESYRCSPSVSRSHNVLSEMQLCGRSISRSHYVHFANPTSYVCSPESLGVVVGAAYVVCMFLFIPSFFVAHAFVTGEDEFPHHRVGAAVWC